MSDSDAVKRILEFVDANKITNGADLLKLRTKNTQGNVVELAGGRLDWSPRKNWVEEEGGLPKYIEKVAIGIMKSGHSREKAIAMAISRIKVWAAGGDGVNKDTQAKAIKALAEWEAMRVKAKARPNKK